MYKPTILQRNTSPMRQVHVLPQKTSIRVVSAINEQRKKQRLCFFCYSHLRARTPYVLYKWSAVTIPQSSYNILEIFAQRFPRKINLLLHMRGIWVQQTTPALSRNYIFQSS